MTSPHKISISSEQKRIEELEEALADLVSWFTTPAVDGRVWLIPAGDRGADDAVNAARAALSNTQPKGEWL